METTVLLAQLLEAFRAKVVVDGITVFAGFHRERRTRTVSWLVDLFLGKPCRGKKPGTSAPVRRRRRREDTQAPLVVRVAKMERMTPWSAPGACRVRRHQNDIKNKETQWVMDSDKRCMSACREGHVRRREEGVQQQSRWVNIDACPSGRCSHQAHVSMRVLWPPAVTAVLATG